VRIDYLADNLAFLPTLAEWHFRQWQQLSGWDSFDQCLQRLRAHAGRATIPTTFIAVADEGLLGSASLIECDMEIRTELSPWLSDLYVAPQRRRRGIGAQLVRRVVEEAARLGVATLYLYTTSKENEEYYARLGWAVRERVIYRDKLRVIMDTPTA
jgi:GNAT superfamily N-acetyltransferase